MGPGPWSSERKTSLMMTCGYAFTMQVCVGDCANGCGCYLGTVIGGRCFKQPKVVPVIQAMSFIFVLQIFGVIAVFLADTTVRLQNHPIGTDFFPT